MTLTPEQRSVVNLVSGRHLVLVPPGSGKTEMLSQRIIRALDSGVDQEKMLCATFTNHAAFTSKAGAVVRMALKTLCHHPNPDEARRRWLEFLKGDFAETAIGCLRTARVYDCEAIGCVRRTAFTSRREHDHRAALEYFKSGLQMALESQVELRAAIGDFVYHRSGMLRLDAATCLAAQGITCWNGIIRGASTDFVRLESIADAEHEETIRAILTKKDLPDEYERRLRRILLARAKRITST